MSLLGLKKIYFTFLHSDFTFFGKLFFFSSEKDLEFWLGHGPLVLDQPVDVVLRAVLGRGDLEHVRDAQQGLLGVAIRYHLE